MFTLYFWYAWGFGRWIEQCSSKRLEDLAEKVKRRSTLTYKITKDGKTIRFKESSYWRLGMVHPPKEAI